MATLAVLGAGMMGSALCLPLVDRGHDVRLIGTHLDEAIIERLKRERVHDKLDYPIPEAAKPYALAELVAALDGADAVCLGVSSAGVRWAARTLRPYLDETLPMLMVSKGLEYKDGTLLTLPEVFCDEAGLEPAHMPCAVAGPCIAGELARREPTCVVFTGSDISRLTTLRDWTRTDYYHVFTSRDVRGVEACAALKNAYAMAMAFASGMHAARGGEPGSIAMHNYEAAVFAQSVIEMQRLVALFGGEPATAVGLAGVGDLNVTCNGGRTGRFGRFLGMGLGRDEAVRRMEGATLECLEILQVMREVLAGFEAHGQVAPEELPLLRHMIAVALDSAPIDVPFERFSASGFSG